MDHVLVAMGLNMTMRGKLHEALEEAKKVDSWAQLVTIVGLGLHQDGTIHMGQENDYVSRWMYGFMNDKGGEAPPRYITVTYWRNGERLVDDNAGNVSQLIPFEDEIIPRLEDSKELVIRFNQHPGHKMMAGKSNDCIVYAMERPMAPMVMLTNWKGQYLRMDPVTMEIF